MIGLTKRGWQNQHIIFGFAFLILSVFHLFFINWKTFLCYLKSKTNEGLKSPVELLTIIILSAFFGLGTYYGIQPFTAVIKFGDAISDSWERQEKQAPVPHAELMTLTQLAEQPGLGGDSEALIKKLEKAGLKGAARNKTLAEIATMNGKTAEEVYECIAPPKTEKHKIQWQGFGKKTLQEIADEGGVSSISLQLALRQKGIEAKPGSPLKTIAENNKIEMSELQKILETMISR